MENIKREYLKFILDNSAEKVLNNFKKSIIRGFILILLLVIYFACSMIYSNAKILHYQQMLYNEEMEVRRDTLNLNITALQNHLHMRDMALSEAGDFERINKCFQKAEIEKEVMNKYFERLKESSLNNEELSLLLERLGGLIKNWEIINDDIRFLALTGDMETCRHITNTQGANQIREISGCIDDITKLTVLQAEEEYISLINYTKFGMYSTIASSMIILLLLIVTMGYIVRHNNHSNKLINQSQEELNASVEELIAMDEALQKSLTDLQEESINLKKVKEKYTNALEAANDAIWEVDFHSNELFASDKWREVTTYPNHGKFILKAVLAKVHPDDVYKVKDIVETRHSKIDIQIRILTRAGDYRWVNIKGKWLYDHDSGEMPTCAAGSISNISKLKESEELTSYLAFHDTLTKLPNRFSFIKNLEVAIADAIVNNSIGAVLFVDIDNFKIINDMYGHNIGDKLLQNFAAKLNYVRKDGHMMARFGGDEFLILIENIPSKEYLSGYIGNILEEIRKPVYVSGYSFNITSSIGVSIFPVDGQDVNTILKNADIAMYESKSRGRNCFVLFDPNMLGKVKRKNDIKDALARAIETNSIYMVFQPQINLKTKNIECFEALMRINDEKLGVCSPLEFISVAEETELIVPLGYWAIRNVIETDKKLRELGFDFKTYSVNISTRQLQEPDFVEQVERIIKETEFDASRLCFEMTESILLSDVDEKRDLFNRLRGIGIKTALDDFGTGYSSFNYLRAIPMDIIKIDKCFVDEIGRNEEGEALIKVIIILAKIFDAMTIAEGVETAEQVNFLRETGVDYIQGYYYGRPLKFDGMRGQLVNWLKSFK